MNLTRRSFLAASVALAAGCSKTPRSFRGSILGGASKFAHRLREGGFPPAGETKSVQVAIVGGGIAGLAAARRLKRQGVHDIILLELEGAAGGNAASGRNAVSAYPWGAHYLPLPNEESHEVCELLQDLGVLTGYDARGLPIYEEEALCADPMERLFDYGRWHEGLVPQLGLTPEDRDQYRRFSAEIETLRQTRDSDGRHAFAIPLDRSSPDFFHLDLLTMEAWLTRQGYTSAPLRWYVDYSCRDDYGAGSAQVSAWAGLHYFASRRGRAANADRDAVLTWPEGNGWLVERMSEPIRDCIRPGSLVFAVDPEQGIVDYCSSADGRSHRLRAQAVICCAPRFVTERITRGLPPAPPMEYSPWMVANLTLDALPGGHGTPLAWDNVMRNSRSLGYVVATHQDLTSSRGPTVITHYWPLDERAPRTEREAALTRSHADWCAQIVADLERAHPEIVPHIQQIDVWLWGHGMIRPIPGYISSSLRAALATPVGRAHFAHSDLSGISIFEEAYTRGVQAADAARSMLS